MSISIVTTLSMQPTLVKKLTRRTPGIRPAISEPPFTLKAQKQVNAINVGRSPRRGRIVDITV